METLNYRYFSVLVARLILTGVFVSAALPKIMDPIAFEASVNAFRVTGPELSAWVALCLPWLELVVGFGLLVPWIQRAGGLLIALLLVVFIGLHMSAWIRGLDISCGCFGTNSSDISPNYLWLITRNLLLLIVCCFVIRCDQKLQTG